jgi:hypothetical protein
VFATFYGILCFLAIDTLPPTSLPGYQSLFFNIAETNANYLAVLFKYVTVPSHHHASSRMSLQEGWVANTSFSTLFCRQLYPDPPLYHHPAYNPLTASSVVLSSLFLIPYTPQPI